MKSPERLRTLRAFCFNSLSHGIRRDSSLGEGASGGTGNFTV